MKLKDYLSTIDDDTIVSIGAAGCGGYIYIGRAGDIDKIRANFDSSHKVLINRCNRLEKTIGHMVSVPPKFTDDTDKNRKIVLIRAEELTEAYNSYKGLKDYLDNYVDPFDRRVMKNYQRDCEEGITLLVKGKEIGKYWFKSEFDKQNG